MERLKKLRILKNQDNVLPSYKICDDNSNVSQDFEYVCSLA